MWYNTHYPLKKLSDYAVFDCLIICSHSNHELADMLGIIEEQNGTLQRQADTIQQLENRLGNLVSENGKNRAEKGQI